VPCGHPIAEEAPDMLTDAILCLIDSARAGAPAG
jgi:hypothetical protein